MRTKAVRMYGIKDLRLEDFELPEIRDDQILARVVSDSICMSSYKAACQGSSHKRVPENIASDPVIVGHEFCGELVQIGSKWKDSFTEGQKFAIQPALQYENGPVGFLSSPGYSYTTFGGDSIYTILPNEVMEQGCLLPYEGDAFFYGSLAEPVSCIVGTFSAMYHTQRGSYQHQMDIREGGSMAFLAGAGPMGLGAVDYAIHRDRRPGLLVVTDIDDSRLKRAAAIYTVEEAKNCGVELHYLNTRDMKDPVARIKEFNSGKGYDDVIVFAPVKAVVEQGDALLGIDGCLNFFAGPSESSFSANMNFYNVHYGSTHIVGTSGGNTRDLQESLKLMTAGRIHPLTMITHVGGLDAVVDTTLHLPEIPGGKKLIYTGISMPLTAIAYLPERGKTDPVCAKLAEITEKAGGLWSPEAEKYLLTHAESI